MTFFVSIKMLNPIVIHDDKLRSLIYAFSADDFTLPHTGDSSKASLTLLTALLRPKLKM